MKLKFDRNSLKATIGINFILFSMILLIFLWATQVLFLNTFYQSMKENTTKNIMRHIETAYDKKNTEDFINTIAEMASNNDVALYITYIDGTPLISTVSDASSSQHSRDIQKVNAAMISQNKDNISIIISEGADERKTLACGKILTSSDQPTLIAYAISPLFPMDSTIAILKKQLLWVTGLSLILAALLALYLSSRISTPIRNITRNANRLAQGEYGIIFQGGHYTEANELADTLTRASIEREKSTSLQKDLIANVSHDLKTPLTAIVTYVDLLKKDDLTEEDRKKYVGILDQKSQRLKVLIEDLFEVSKAASGNIQMNFMDVDVVSLMKEIRLEMEEKILASDLNFKWNLPEEKLILLLDGQKTFRIFENLLNNILKYSLPYSRVYVDIINEDQQVRIVFRNISAMELPEDVERLTERFVRGDESRQTDGSGLGLAIVKSFVELQNGKFEITMDGDLFKATILWNK